MNNVINSIGWADYTWNPVTGCKRGCEYCYARKIHNRFNSNPFTDIVFHPKRLNDLSKIADGSRVFVGSMSDIQYWENDITEQIINACEYYFKIKFMFLSKEWSSYTGFDWPKNTMQGLTIELKQGKALQHSMIYNHSASMRPFLSIEPISGPLLIDIPESIELVIVGAETGNRKNKIIPEKDWIHSITDHVPADKIYWKKNIKKYFPEIFQ